MICGLQWGLDAELVKPIAGKMLQELPVSILNFTGIWEGPILH